jgi:hypothetical protein
MGTENFDLKPAQQCTQTEQGHFGELMKEVYQGQSGLLARQETWNQVQWSGLEHDLMFRSDRDGRQDPGPYNKTFLDMTFGGDVYSLGQDTKTLTVDGKPVPTGSAQYKEAIAKMETAEKSINFDAPACPAGSTMGLWENLDQKR